MGAATMNDDKLYERLKFLQKATGIVPSPFDCYQVNRSLKTLSLRMDKCMENTIAVAKFLESHLKIEKVLYPALPSHPQHELALKQTYGCSSVFSFYLKGADVNVSDKFLKSLKLFTLAGSLGNINSTIEVPSILSHSSIPVEERIELGITDSLIRVSVGLENIEDLVNDLKQALGAAYSK